MLELEMAPPAPPVDTEHLDDIDDLVSRRAFATVFQPILDFSVGTVLGFEAASRGATNSPLHSPLTLFDAAGRCGRLPEVDRVCNTLACERFAEQSLPGLLFLNCTTPSFLQAAHGSSDQGLFGTAGMNPRRIVIEVTEQEPCDDYVALRQAAEALRRRGFHIAVDDLGAGYAGLRYWTELRPDFVKIDRHFVEDIETDRNKQSFVKSIIDVAQRVGCAVVAEGIETAEQLDALRGLGITLGQGFYLGLPRVNPSTVFPDAVRPAHARGTRAIGRRTAAGELAEPSPVVPDTMPAELVLEKFLNDRSLIALPVVRNHRPVGLVTRQDLLDVFSARYRRELHGRKQIATMMQTRFTSVDSEVPLEEVSRLMTATGRGELAQVFVITSDGAYVGIGHTGELLQRITAQQLRAARYSHPLSGLPGSVPINEHIDALLIGGEDFRVAYLDLNNFKPYNDLYGFARGDEVLLKLAEVISRHVDARLDLLGHVGGDDFIAVFRSADWLERCRGILQQFDALVPQHYPRSAIEQGGVVSENRLGRIEFFNLMGLAIGVVACNGQQYAGHGDVIAAATAAKRLAKKSPGSAVEIHRPQP